MIMNNNVQEADQGPYDRLYKSIDRVWPQGIGHFVEVLIETAPPEFFEQARILDVGGGEGDNAIALASKGGKVTLVEISSVACRRIIQRISTENPSLLEKISVQCADASKHPFPGQNRIVVAYGLLHCFPDEATASKVASGLKEAVAEDGVLVISVIGAETELSAVAHPELENCFRPFAAQLESWFPELEIRLKESEHVFESHGEGPEHEHMIHRYILARPACQVTFSQSSVSTSGQRRSDSRQ